MKKFTIITILALLLIASFPVPQQSSWYAIANINKMPLSNGVWADLDEKYFYVKYESVMHIDGTVFKPSMSTLVKISGRCLLKRPPDTVFAGRIIAGGVTHNLGSTTGDTLIIAFTMPAEDMTMGFYQDSSLGLNSIVCNILFETVR